MNNECAALVWEERLGSRSAEAEESERGSESSLLIALISHTDTAASEIFI